MSTYRPIFKLAGNTRKELAEKIVHSLKQTVRVENLLLWFIVFGSSFYKYC